MHQHWECVTKDQPSPGGTADLEPGAFDRRRPQPSLRDLNPCAWRPPTLKCWAILKCPFGTLALAGCSAGRFPGKDELLPRRPLSSGFRPSSSDLRSKPSPPENDHQSRRRSLPAQTDSSLWQPWYWAAQRYTGRLTWAAVRVTARFSNSTPTGRPTPC
jgi:hypothetical protein